IDPFRASKSAQVYKKLWTKEGSPLLLYSIAAQKLLQKELGDGYGGHLAMRYKNPSIPDVLEEMGRRNYDDIIVLPMFPQYASACTGSALDQVMRVVKKWCVIPEVRLISQYYDHPTFIHAVVARSRRFNLSDYDHVLFSYHG